MAKLQATARREPEPRRDQVLRVAEALFARGGYRGVGLREIAAQVGIRAPSLFKHFRSKQALYNAVLLNIFGRLNEVAGVPGGRRAVRGAPRAVHQRLRRSGRQRPARRPAALPRADGALRGHGRRRRARAALEIYRRIDVFLEAGQKAGEFRQVDRFRFQIALTGAILYHGLAAKPYQAALLDRVGPPDRAAWKRTVLDLARGALLRAPPLSPRRARTRREADSHVDTGRRVDPRRHRHALPPRARSASAALGRRGGGGARGRCDRHARRWC